VLTVDDTDDESLQPDDVLATSQEIAEAAALAGRDPALRTRLMLAAKFILARSRELKRTCEPEDLLQEALEATLVGRRKWPKNRVDFKGLLVGVMRSIAWSRGNSLSKKAPDVTTEHELMRVGEELDPLSLEEMAADPLTVEDSILRKEGEMEEEGALASLRARYGPDDPLGRILDTVREGFVSHLEVREALGIEESAYRNAWKALMRAAEKLNAPAKE
jgi:DNA-directed RNA polymerase specialized sigma24 family protein